ncbi:hypothetical protein CWS43_22895 [Rahnella sp. AA]|nr:hypothetical protein CWS43_22895 [Rahnella sp. AA]
MVCESGRRRGFWPVTFALQYCAASVSGAGILSADSAQQPERTQVREDCEHCPISKAPVS